MLLLFGKQRGKVETHPETLQREAFVCCEVSSSFRGNYSHTGKVFSLDFPILWPNTCGPFSRLKLE
jgi:hypothetical protein